MAKLKSDPIGVTELVEYLDTSSDFAFELRCLKRLSALGFRCSHGGSYEDRVTKKTRQFDIRALLEHGDLRVRCAVECKNLSEWYPLLLTCVPRSVDESFHQLVFSFPPVVQPHESSAFSKYCEAVKFAHPKSEYAFQGPVGKSCVQVGKAPDGSIISTDADVFDKWSQALASAHDLADDAAEEGELTETEVFSLILPIVMVPDGTLWRVDYSADGSRCSDPKQIDRCSFYVGHTYEAGGRVRGTMLVLSHLEFVTLSGIEKLAGGLLPRNNSWFQNVDSGQLVKGVFRRP